MNRGPKIPGSRTQRARCVQCKSKDVERTGDSGSDFKGAWVELKCSCGAVWKSRAQSVLKEAGHG